MELLPIKFKIPIEAQLKEQVSKKLEPIRIYPRFVDIKTTQTQAIFLSEARTVYSINFSKFKDAQLECVQIKKLTNIAKIDASFTHFLALQKEELPPIQEWTPQQVADFVTRIGFKEAANIVIYSKITGDKIKEFDEDYIQDNFGIIGVNEMQKLRFEINQHQERRLVSQAIYGWGSNTHCQLGISAISIGKNLPHPQLIPVPKEIESMKEEIKDVACGKRHSVLLTTRGQIWAIGNINTEKKLQSIKDQISAETEEELEHKKKGGKGKKQEKKASKSAKIQEIQDARSENKLVNLKEKEVGQRWV